MVERRDKSFRGDASQFFIAGELCRRGVVAVVTLGNCPNTDILCSNHSGRKFVHIQVKTFVPGNRTCSVGKKAEIYYGEKFFWVIGGIPTPDQRKEFEYYVIPSKVMSDNISAAHKIWKATPGKNGQTHQDTDIRALFLPPSKSPHNQWNILEYKNRWDLILDALGD